LKRGLSKTRESFVSRISDVVRRKPKLDEEALDEIEEILISSDVGVETSVRIMDRIRAHPDLSAGGSERIWDLLKAEMLNLMDHGRSLEIPDGVKPYVIMVVGVNGVGKTTTIGKLAWRFVRDGRKVLLAASDTFRAAAIEQLEIWAGRAGAEMVRHAMGADPASVAFDALSAAKARGADVLIVDTAGRLHTKRNLMEELKKVKRVLGKQMEGAPHEILLVLDATTGQNAISQARQFNEALGITGIAVAKLDGTAKGGAVVAISDTIGVPVKAIGVGEKPEDLRDFDPEAFVEAILGR